MFLVDAAGAHGGLFMDSRDSTVQGSNINHAEEKGLLAVGPNRADAEVSEETGAIVYRNADEGLSLGMTFSAGFFGRGMNPLNGHRRWRRSNAFLSPTILEQSEVIAASVPM